MVPSSTVKDTNRAAARCQLALVASIVIWASIQSPFCQAQVAPEHNLTFVAIGDIGEAGNTLSSNARSIVDLARSSDRKPLRLLFFLGDNFYPIGLNHDRERQDQLIHECLGPFLGALSRLGPNNVHAVPGNHDYYCDEIGPVPYGRCIRGNIREREIPYWTYHLIMPAIVRRATRDNSPDSVDFILFDSAVLLASDIRAWRTVLDSLESLLGRSASATGVQWRILIAHHSPVSVGEHSGWRQWSARDSAVQWVGNCWDDGMDPRKYLEQLVSSQDNCADLYRAYSDSLQAILRRTGAMVQAMIAGHDHSLQLLDVGAGPSPRIYVVSGAGAQRTRVRRPFPPMVWTHPSLDEEGLSAGGFVLGEFTDEVLTLRFIGGPSGNDVDMGGRTEFRIGRNGTFAPD